MADLAGSWEVLVKPSKTAWSRGHRQTAQVRGSINSTPSLLRLHLAWRASLCGGLRGPPGLADLCQQEQRSRKRLRTLSKGEGVGCSLGWAIDQSKQGTFLAHYSLVIKSQTTWNQIPAPLLTSCVMLGNDLTSLPHFFPPVNGGHNKYLLHWIFERTNWVNTYKVLRT